MNEYDFTHLKREIELNLHKQKQLWTRQQAQKFLRVLNIRTVLKEHFESLAINGEKLFSSKYGACYLLENLEPHLDENSYLPISKLLIISHWMANQQNGMWSLGDLQGPDSPGHRDSLISLESKDNFWVAGLDKPKEKNIDFPEQLVQMLIEQLDLLEKESEKRIVDLTIEELVQIMINMKQDRYVKVISEYNIDGFALIYTLMDSHFINDMRNYFPEEELGLVEDLSNLFVLMYFREQVRFNAEMLEPTMSERTLESQGSHCDLLSIGTTKQDSSQSSVHELTSEEVMRKLSGDKDISPRDHFDDGGMDNSQLDFDMLVRENTKDMESRNSVIRESQKHRVSEVRYSELGVSEYCVSERGSEMYADSVIMDSFIMPDSASGNANVVGYDGRMISTIENPDIFKELKEISPGLQFNLLNLEPLRWIRITRLPTATSKDLSEYGTEGNLTINNSNMATKAESAEEKVSPSKRRHTQKIETKIFSLKGAKFGRNKENDFEYPDETSISGKHAQVYFNGGYFYLQDVGSKTGTFIRIQDPVILKDESCIQLSNEVEIVIKVLKKDQDQGLVKIEFNKPQNFQGYRVSLKNGYPIKLGRHQHSHIKIDEKRTTVSSKHACIKYEDRKFWFIDRKSMGGSWLRLSKKSAKSEGYRLSVGDIFRISYKKSFIIEEIKELEQQPDK